MTTSRPTLQSTGPAQKTAQSGEFKRWASQTRFGAVIKMLNVLAVILLLPMLGGCVTFYQNPTASEPASVFVERGERQGLMWYRYFTLAEIDGLPVSHMGASSDGNEIRVHPGLRRMVFKVGYMGGEGTSQSDGCQCRAVFPVEMTVISGRRYRLGGEVQSDHTVTLTMADPENPDVPPIKLETRGAPVPKNMTIGVARGVFVTIPAR